jgi:hypothetical protein
MAVTCAVTSNTNEQFGYHLSARMSSVRLRTAWLGDRWAVTCQARGQLKCHQLGDRWGVTSYMWDGRLSPVRLGDSYRLN